MGTDSKKKKKLSLAYFVLALFKVGWGVRDKKKKKAGKIQYKKLRWLNFVLCVAKATWYIIFEKVCKVKPVSHL